MNKQELQKIFKTVNKAAMDISKKLGNRHWFEDGSDDQ